MIPIVNINEIPSLHDGFEIKSSFDAEIASIFLQPLSEKEEAQHLKLIFSLIDLTSLNGNDTSIKIEKLCNQVLALEQISEIPSVAAVCVYPTFAKQVKHQLKNTNIHTVCVAGAFPSGQTAIEIKLKEVEWAIQQGATEIDMVISRGKLIEGNYQAVFDEIVAIKKCCDNLHLKVILETGELINNKNIRIASDIAMYAGADFIKTATGKISEGATYNGVCIMLHAINDFYAATGIKVGIKPAGGISTIATASNYLKLTAQIVGVDWLNSHLFRFGASSLANQVLNDLSTHIKHPNLLNYFKNE